MNYLVYLLSGAGLVSASAPACTSPWAAETSQTSGCIAACHSLSQKFADNVFAVNSSGYSNVTSSYWAYQQQIVQPACIFEPANAQQVAHVVQLSQEKGCPFAVKSGGHGAFSGVSNIEHGITISLEKLDSVSVSEDLSTVTFGTGNRWITLYERLGEYNLAVAGGRYPTVGVGGLTLGGGQSFFATAQGWTCDSIQSYELVTANGTILEVNGTSYPDLHWALRGGGNNLGIVTKMKMETIPLQNGKMWGGLRIFTEDKFPQVLQAANALGGLDSDQDTGGAQIINWMVAQGQKLAVAILTYSQPVREPDVMSQYLSIPAIVDTTSVRSLTNMSAELAAAEDEQSTQDRDQLFKARGTATFLLNEDILGFAKDTCFDAIDSLSQTEGVTPQCVFQVITTPQLEATVARGGNALGLDPADGPLFLLNIQVSWLNDSNSQEVRQAVQQVIDSTVTYAKFKGWDRRFRYMNYAGEF